MEPALLSPAFLFRFAVPCKPVAIQPQAPPVELTPQHQLHGFSPFDRQKQFAELRAGWHRQGLALDVNVRGKKQSLWCRASRIEESDGLHLWIDTRDAHNVHRANRFCHHFVFLPCGDEKRVTQPVGALLPINRARENARPIDPRELHLRSQTRRDGYRLLVFIPATAITGFDPAEQPRLGFFYAVVDRELGLQTLSVGQEFPYDEDPSVWSTLELLRD